ncbi:MAG: hypothetical protein A2X12_04065 [Bacteroidetes bacterium GWE2_29_8]|nr:MAG: hypothetical protein A2X12_04065 [Bacteroidetes bacterium GWE2_29_8]OFY24957.1 MAG: hypothetical protein A2X02_07915 [Bacteroidetes bacterium GWF2_29_10]
MIKIILIYCLLLLFNNSFAKPVEDTLKVKKDSVVVWKMGGLFTTTLSQVKFENWAQGGKNSFSNITFLNLYVNYKKGKNVWDNTFDLRYGVYKNKDEALMKMDDKIDFSSKYGLAAGRKWYYSALINAKTQFNKGYSYGKDTTIISDFLAPAYITMALGMDYKPSDKFTLFLSPFSGKSTIVNNRILANRGMYGVEKARMDNTGKNVIEEGKRIRNEFGGYIKTMLSFEIVKNISFQSKLDMFSNYMEKAGNIDVNWEVLLTMKINKYVSANINTQLIYDDDVATAIDTNNDKKVDLFLASKTQFKETFGISFSFKF